VIKGLIPGSHAECKKICQFVEFFLVQGETKEKKRGIHVYICAELVMLVSINETL
jgi:hypothetical protein